MTDQPTDLQALAEELGEYALAHEPDAFMLWAASRLLQLPRTPDSITTVISSLIHVIASFAYMLRESIAAVPAEKREALIEGSVGKLAQQYAAPATLTEEDTTEEDTTEEDALVDRMVMEVDEYLLTHTKDEFFTWIGPYLARVASPDQALTIITAFVNISANITAILHQCTAVMTDEQLDTASARPPAQP